MKFLRQRTMGISALIRFWTWRSKNYQKKVRILESNLILVRIGRGGEVSFCTWHSEVLAVAMNSPPWVLIIKKVL